MVERRKTNMVKKLNGKTYIITFLNKNFKTCEEKDAYMISIDEYDEKGKFVQNVLGFVEDKKTEQQGEAL